MVKTVSKQSPQGLHITYFPYLGMKDSAEVEFNDLNLKVWNYSKKADEYIKDSKLRKTLDSIMSTNVTHWQTINDMGIVTIGDCNWREYTVEEAAICREARLLLFIGALSYGGILKRGANTGWHMFTSENFEMVRQNFQKGGDRMGTEAGYIVQKWAGGYKIDEVKFMQPEYTPTPTRFTANDYMINTLMIIRHSQKRLYRRLMRSIDVFMQAYYNDTKLSEQARTLLVASAFEILFDLPDRKQREALKKIFKQQFVDPKDIKRRYTSLRGSNGFEWEKESIKVMWADKFYTLRNKIIHGSIVKPDDYVFCRKQRHFDIATLFFVLGLKKVMGSVPQIEQTTDNILWEKYEDLDGEEQYEGFVYEEMDSWAAITRGLFV